MNNKDTFISSTASVVKHLKEELDLDAKPHEVRKIMREELDMRFGKIKEVPPHANSPVNLIMRQ